MTRASAGSVSSSSSPQLFRPLSAEAVAETGGATGALEQASAGLATATAGVVRAASTQHIPAAGHHPVGGGQVRSASVDTVPLQTYTLKPQPLSSRRRESFFTPELNVSMEDLLHARKFAAVVIQSHWRGFSARRKLQRDTGRSFHRAPNPDFVMRTRAMRAREALPDCMFLDGKVCEEDEVLGEFEMMNRLGDGNFADVVKCRRRSTRTVHAAKIIPKYRVYRPETRALMKSELSVLQIVNHGNIIHMHDAYETRTHVYLILEFVNSGDLFDMIVKAGHFSEADARAVMYDMCSALQYLHARRIIHRDIKPENIMCHRRPDGGQVMKLVDFGLATKVTGPLFDVCGSPTYMAPEIALRSSHGYNVEADLWSLGVVMFVMFTGFPPFNIPLNYDKITSAHYGEPDLTSEEWVDVTEQAKELITLLLQRNPDKRTSANRLLRLEWFKRETRALAARRRQSVILNLQQFRPESRRSSRVSIATISTAANPSSPEPPTPTITTTPADELWSLAASSNTIGSSDTALPSPQLLMNLSNRSQIAGVLAQLSEMEAIDDDHEGEFAF
ncbi:camk/dcamkl protein kinase [Salpingoeca rosetta]|uniref:Camk/dcamkl protein kinase n=1 Tax=Salpingoeca rosetta (strain ATCC 50818 / BSB-021) TaxID=946362 RepID=F2UPJ1_SALR5|nr:camk/dcamkl protein kinase [Salpingoeca rosetta]EGD79546.1 camk/dcamkl protein kinase [Salpingoeca rosetta]|eukprot:XP_004989027.1 camk/dcamkl protein kinase [Salpingoeca rosetta]